VFVAPYSWNVCEVKELNRLENKEEKGSFMLAVPTIGD
jgi:hypothetical protein